MAALDDLRNEIASQPLKPLYESAADVAFGMLNCLHMQAKPGLKYHGICRNFFLPKLLEAVGYFQPGDKTGKRSVWKAETRTNK